MVLFDRCRVVQSGFTVLQLAVLGLGAGLVWIVGTAVADLASTRPMLSSLRNWEYLRSGLGTVVGTPLYGWLAGRIRKAGLLSQMFAIVFAIGGGGALTILVAELLVRRLPGL